MSETAVHSSSGLAIHLLGPPRLAVDGGGGYRFRSRKSWAVLAFLVLAERPPSRAQLASLLFADAEDPLRALRWSLAEIRRGLGAGARLDGDPVSLKLAPGTTVDVDLVVHGHWRAAVEVAHLDADLLEGVAVSGASAFESWLLFQRRRLAAAAESILHEGALGRLAEGDLDQSRALALKASILSPLDENHQALLVRLYRLAGEDEAAERQFSAWAETADRELGATPGAAMLLARRERRRGSTSVGIGAVQALTEAGAAAVSAGALRAAVESFDTAIRLADDAGSQRLRVETRLVLAEALVHSFGGLDEEGLAMLTEAERIAQVDGDLVGLAGARTELGYVDFLRGRYDRAERHLNQVLADRAIGPEILAKAGMYLGSVASDLGAYERAESLLRESVELARTTGTPRLQAYALSMRGRIRLLRGELVDAEDCLARAVEVAQADHWLSFLPWPQALLGHARLLRGDLPAAASSLDQSFARACQIGDPCWEGISARGLALLHRERGDVDRAFSALLDARSRGKRLADPYVWLDVFILDALCELGREQGHPATAAWAEEMHALASGAGMRELTVRAMLHRAALGRLGDVGAAALFAADLDNPVLAELVTAATP